MVQTLVSKMEVCVGYSVWSKPLKLRWRSLCGLQCMEQTLVRISEMEKSVWAIYCVWGKPSYLRWRSWMGGVVCVGNTCMEQTLVAEREQFVWETHVWSKPL